MNQQQKALILEALNRLGDEDNMNRYKHAISKGTAAYPRSVLTYMQESVNLLEKRIALACFYKNRIRIKLTFLASVCSFISMSTQNQNQSME